MVTLKVGMHKLSVHYHGETVFHKNSPTYGGALSKLILKAVDLPEDELGVWVLRTDKPDLLASLFKVLAEVDLRRDGDKVRSDLTLDEVTHTVSETEKVMD